MKLNIKSTKTVQWEKENLQKEKFKKNQQISSN